MARILVIDDDDEALLYAQSVLCKEHAVMGVNSWIKASEALLHEKFDLILLDIDMPGLSGDKLAAILQRRFTDAPLNIVLFSGIDEAELEQKAAEVGAKGVIRKPCPHDLFALRVRRFLR
jgi:CheY-like chemotaxis protein